MPIYTATIYVSCRTDDNSTSQDYISFPSNSKINSELFQKCNSHTLVLCGGRFWLYNLFFQEAQDYAVGTNFVRIFMEVSTLTVENVVDLFFQIGK